MLALSVKLCYCSFRNTSDYSEIPLKMNRKSILQLHFRNTTSYMILKFLPTVVRVLESFYILEYILNVAYSAISLERKPDHCKQ